MTKEEGDKILRDMLTEDFNTMREMLSAIEMKLLGVDLNKQIHFIGPIKTFIKEAWLDACNPSDTFLYPSPTPTDNKQQL